MLQHPLVQIVKLQSKDPFVTASLHEIQLNFKNGMPNTPSFNSSASKKYVKLVPASLFIGSSKIGASQIDILSFIMKLREITRVCHRLHKKTFRLCRDHGLKKWSVNLKILKIFDIKNPKKTRGEIKIFGENRIQKLKVNRSAKFREVKTEGKTGKIEN
jgi:hypothetical protein